MQRILWNSLTADPKAVQAKSSIITSLLSAKSASQAGVRFAVRTAFTVFVKYVATGSVSRKSCAEQRHEIHHGGRLDVD